MFELSSVLVIQVSSYPGFELWSSISEKVLRKVQEENKKKFEKMIVRFILCSIFILILIYRKAPMICPTHP